MRRTEDSTGHWRKCLGEVGMEEGENTILGKVLLSSLLAIGKEGST